MSPNWFGRGVTLRQGRGVLMLEREGRGVLLSWKEGEECRCEWREGVLVSGKEKSLVLVTEIGVIFLGGSWRCVYFVCVCRHKNMKKKSRMKWSQVDLLRLLCGGRSLSPFLVKEFLHIDTGCGDVEKIFTVAKYREQKWNFIFRFLFWVKIILQGKIIWLTSWLGSNFTNNLLNV